ncbi:OLC1v1000556C1 [Oldenlandia corymbosa var. corymbosa]|uniref:OLC1v1000556C1 n=1 Tax=Oldenlandia corymbosa var. corymbosa TaxID=529605 RepID=A0AAV1D5M7_OLDCO|nr:OLC1v1000556C1 [Oldenlandia corymbosa var. corymbosa]
MEMHSLPEEALTEILVKLPIRSVLRCISVCKTWKALIRNPYFADYHLKNHQDNKDDMVLIRQLKYENLRCISQDLFLTRDDHHKKLHLLFPRLELPNPDQVVYARGSCNGILCFSDIHCRFVYLCNPITRECFTLPESTLADPGCPLVELGFGFDPYTKDYKVIAILERNPGPVWIQIYKLSTNCWSRVDIDELENGVFSINGAGSGVFFKGILHWWMGSRLRLNDHVLTFDLHAERFGSIECPNLFDNPNSILTVLGGDSLALVSMVKRAHDGYAFRVWVMKEYGNHESWTHKYTIAQFLADYCRPFWHEPSGEYHIPSWRHLTCWNGDELLLVNLEDQEQMVSYKLFQKNDFTTTQEQCKEVDIGRDLLKSHINPRVIKFQPSLESISRRRNYFL